MSFRFLCLAAAAALPLLPAPSPAAPAADSPTSSATIRRPNIVVIVADDMGYAEFGLQGNKEVPTPNIDSIGKSGVRFTNGYVSCPVCSPTRAGLMTGRYQERFGHELNPGPTGNANGEFGLSLSEKTLASALKEQGYATGIFGKWHLGAGEKFHPMSRGFDEFFGFYGGAHPYMTYESGTRAIMRGRSPETGPEVYTTTAFGREAVSFVERHQKEPFFLYLPFNAVHSPLQAPQEYIDRFQSITEQKRRTFDAMLAAMDDEIGKVLKKIRDAGLEENTLIFFFSDNGGPTLSTTSNNYPLRGYKGQVFEGGFRVPFEVQWKGHIPGGQVYDKPVISLDVFPTAVAAAGGQPASNLDGVNLLPYLEGKASGTPHEQLFWRFGVQWATRKGDWKLLSMGKGEPQLYNLAQDIGEKTDLATSEPQKVAELKAAYDKWDAELIPPKWKGKARFHDPDAVDQQRKTKPGNFGKDKAAKAEKPGKAGKKDKADKADKAGKAERKQERKAAKRTRKHQEQTTPTVTEQ